MRDVVFAKMQWESRVYIFFNILIYNELNICTISGTTIVSFWIEQALPDRAVVGYVQEKCSQQNRNPSQIKR